MTEVLAWHSEPWGRIATARRRGRMPHALLLAGRPGLGKAAFARRLSAALVCADPSADGDACGLCGACRQSRAGSHPDQHWVTPEAPGKSIRIDAIRDLTAKSVLAAQQGGYRVFVIEPAEQMNRAAANALLKTLEEPASRSILILVSSQPHRLPATIRSRCQLVKFLTPPPAQVREWLRQQAGLDQFDDLLAVSGGAPLLALKALEEGWVDAGRQLSAELASLKRRAGNPLQIVEEWEKRPLTLLFDSMKRCVTDLVRLASGLGEGMLYHPGLRTDLQSLAAGIDLRSLYRFSDELLQLDRDASHNPNAQMMLEHIANRWLQITRPGGH